MKLTGDASRDTTLDLCNLGAAHSLVALTNVDTLNLEIALGARVRNPTMPIVLRIAETTFANSIARHFEFETTFSAAALAAPAFVGLSRFPGSRGRVAFGGEEYAIGEIRGEGLARNLPENAIPIAASRESRFEITHELDSLGPGDRALVLVPTAPFREGKETHLLQRRSAIVQTRLKWVKIRSTAVIADYGICLTSCSSQLWEHPYERVCWFCTRRLIEALKNGD